MTDQSEATAARIIPVSIAAFYGLDTNIPSGACLPRQATDWVAGPHRVHGLKIGFCSLAESKPSR